MIEYSGESAAGTEFVEDTEDNLNLQLMADIIQQHQQHIITLQATIAEQSETIAALTAELEKHRPEMVTARGGEKRWEL